MTRNAIRRYTAMVLFSLAGCAPMESARAPVDDGPAAEGILGMQGDPVAYATSEQLATFERGKAVFAKRFDLADGLGPAFNLTSCGGCHERPTSGGAAALYRNFHIAGRRTEDGAFIFSESAGMAGGVLRVFSYDPANPFRPEIPATTTIFAQRHAIPMFGAGLIAELSDEEILSRADVDDADGDGISGKPNFDRGFVGRFGRKCQTGSIEGFIRGQLLSHLGITTVPLSDEQRTRLPVDSSAPTIMKGLAEREGDSKFSPQMQAAAPDAPNADNDGVADPEMSAADLFDLISFSMSLAAPRHEPPSEQSNRGRLLFHAAGCSACHVPRLLGPRGPVPAYSDLLLHDMGDALADGIVMKEASGREFRTQPLWGISSVGPYLHDGRAETLEDAILAHGGEAQDAAEAFAVLSGGRRADVVEFLLSLGGRGQKSAGLVAPNEPTPPVAAYGGPLRELFGEEEQQFLRGREIFDRDFGFKTGVGAMAGADGGARFNGDSCRACHFDPVIGGAGPRDVNVMRHGTMDDRGTFSPPATTSNTILHKQIRIGFRPPSATADINVFEHRQTPHLFGAGLIDAISEETILSNADPADVDGDGISGRAHVLSDDGRVGRFGWKADVPSLAEFVREEMAAELGITLPPQPGLSFGITEDADGVPDPELSVTEIDDINFFIRLLAGPPRQLSGDSRLTAAGEVVFSNLGCAKCHVPALESRFGDVPLFSDLLLHDILAAGAQGIVSGDATATEFRTAPLWGLSVTAPYFHSGEADTIDQAILLHDGEATEIRAAYAGLPEADRAALVAFLSSL